MAEYIERDALIADIEENLNTYWNEGYGGYYLAEDALEDSVKIAPTADVVKVVRCKECEFAKPQALKLNGKELRRCDLHKRPCFLTDFCSYGELKECNNNA